MNWIERYIQEVVHYLPEKERREVADELRGNLYEMLPEDSDEQTIKATLEELGAPQTLANRYRQKPQYLIGPNYYYDYLAVLKKVVPIAGIIGFLIGFLAFLLEKIAKTDALRFTVNVFTKSLSEGIGVGISLAVQACLWVTIVFIIMERTGTKVTKKWQVEDLPLAREAQTIKLSDALSELVLLILMGIVLGYFIITKSPVLILDYEPVNIFNQTFLKAAIPIIALTLALGIAESITKLIIRRYSKVVVAVTVISNLITVPLWCWLLTRSPIFADSFLNSRKWGDSDILHYLKEGTLPLGLIIACIVLLSGLGGCATAFYRYFKEKRYSN